MSEEQKRVTEIVAVSIDPKEDLQKMVDRVAKEDGKAPEFVMLSDPGHRVIARYGLLNPDDARNIPHPTTFVIDRDGLVRWRFTEVNYRIRPTNEDILKALAGLR